MGKTATWNEFKAHVDALIAQQGATGDVTIDYIDISDPVIDVVGKATDGYKRPCVVVDDGEVTIY
jgi:hypothetical protein